MHCITTLHESLLSLYLDNLKIAISTQNIHSYDIGSLIENLGIAGRTGQHCAQPIMDFFKIPGTVRISFCFYNTTDEIDTLINALKKASKMLS